MKKKIIKIIQILLGLSLFGVGIIKNFPPYDFMCIALGATILVFSINIK